MIYDIKPIPTVYAGVQFRSRLEAKWAAWFDLMSLDWQYEPFDLEGWAPDFLIRAEWCDFCGDTSLDGPVVWRPIDVLVEVKPVRMRDAELKPTFKSLGMNALRKLNREHGSLFQKAVNHASNHQIMLCGTTAMIWSGGLLLPMPSDVATSDSDVARQRYTSLYDSFRYGLLKWEDATFGKITLGDHQAKSDMMWAQAGNKVMFKPPR